MRDKQLIVPARGLALPEHLRNPRGRQGLEQLTTEDLILPRLSICQAVSAQRKRTSSLYIEGLAEGALFNTLTDEVYGESLDFIPVKFARKRSYFSDFGGSTPNIICKSNDAVHGSVYGLCSECKYAEFRDGKPPECNLTMNFASIALVRAKRELLVISFKSTGLRVARRFLTYVNSLDEMPVYASVFRIRTALQNSKKGSYYVPVISHSRFVDEQELAYAAKVYASLEGRSVKTAEDQDN